MSRSRSVKPLSLRGFAAHRRALGLPGGTLRAVQEAVGATRIPMRPDGRIDPAEADEAWKRNTDDSRRPHRSNGNGHAPSIGLSAQKEKDSFQRTRQLELENDRRAGTLVEAVAVERRWVTHVVTARTHLMGLPSRLKLLIPSLSHHDLALIAREITHALEELADRIQTEEETDADPNGHGAAHCRRAPDPEPLASPVS